MTCRHEGELRAYLDSALGSAEREATEQHIEGCAVCRESLAQLQQRVAVVRARLQSVAPVRESRPTQALAQLRVQIAQQDDVRIPILRRWL